MSELFDDYENEWQKEWKDMPEFIQNKKEPFAKIIVRFDGQSDLDHFSSIIGQKITKKTKSIWFPFKSHWGKEKKIWTHEE